MQPLAALPAQQPTSTDLEPQKSIAQILETGWWHTITMLHCPASQVELLHIARPEPEPEAAKELRIAEWNSRIEKKFAELSSINPGKTYALEPDSSGQQTLFEVVDGKNIARMWDGTTISTSSRPEISTDGKFKLAVHLISSIPNGHRAPTLITGLNI